MCIDERQLACIHNIEINVFINTITIFAQKPYHHKHRQDDYGEFHALQIAK